MSRHDLQRLDDIRAACAAIAEHLTHGDLAQGLVFDAIRVRLIEIGESVKALDAELLATETEIPWRQISKMREQLAHRYLDTSHAVVAGTVARDLPELGAAVERLPTRHSSKRCCWASRTGGRALRHRRCVAPRPRRHRADVQMGRRRLDWTWRGH